MKKLMFAALAVAAFSVFADADPKAKENKEAPVQKQEAPIFWGFANYGIYSGYQLYGSLVNNEPTAQGYVEGNFNLNVNDFDLGYLGVGVWSNSDLTNRRGHYGLGNLFNEWDFNIHWARTFWFDDDKTWGLTYRTSVVWYYYPGENYKRIHPASDTTFDWDHYFELVNPYLIPYVNVVREYRFGGNLCQFGVKKPFQITDQLSICPFIEFVARDNRYNWCFPTRFGQLAPRPGLATFKAEIDGTYMLTPNFGLFAKFAFCSIVDQGMRDNIDHKLDPSEYGAYAKDFVWGGVGICMNF